MLTTVHPQRHLYVQSDMQSPELLAVSDGQVVSFCRRCPDSAQPNDDCAAVIETACGSTILIVADGVGGCPMGFAASALAVEVLTESILAVGGGTKLRSAILDGFERANEEVLDLGVGAATTLSAVEIRNGRARAYHVGDCMSLIVGQRGMLKWRSTPHSPIGYAVESGFLGEADAMHHDDRNVVSNLVGCRSMHIDIGPIHDLSARDTIIVGSDGLFDNLHLDEVIQCARSGPPMERMTQLVDLATHRMQGNEPGAPCKPDDLSVLLYTG